jgi:monoamine oxidase
VALNRRELLTILLGAPLAFEACRRESPPEVRGSVVGGAMNLGHLLRQKNTVELGAPTQRVGVAIVGSGLSGLSAAWRLLAKGESDFVVLELEKREGGTATYGTDAVVPYPWAAHYVPVPDDESSSLSQLLAELGALEHDEVGRLVPREELRVRDPEERIFVGDRWVEGLVPTPLLGPEDRAQIARFQELVDEWVAFRDSDQKRAFALPLARCTSDNRVLELDRISAEEYLMRHGLNSRHLRWMLSYACRDDYGTSLASTSAWALLFYHASRVKSPGQPSAPYLTWPEGNGRIVRHLAERVGSRLMTQSLVLDVVPQEDSVDLTILDARLGRVSVLRADYVVVATPTFVAARIVRPLRDNPPDYLASFSYCPWLVANIHASRRPSCRGVPFAWDNVIYGGASLGYVSATHQTLRDDGPTVLTYYQPFTDDDPKIARARLAVATHRGACEAIFAELLPALPELAEVVTRIDVWHWGHGMVRPTPGTFTSALRRRASEPLGRIHFAHTDLSGVALLEEAHHHGVRAADAIFELRHPSIGELSSSSPKE